MMRSLFAGVSGLRNHQTRMDVIGNNIANVNTVGFKGSRVNFQDVLSQTLQGAASAQGNRGGTNPMQVGLGMGLASIDTVFTDGSVQPTGKQTDLAIQGQGFFVLSDGLNQIFTRAGAFDFDSQGNFLVPGTGYKVTGWTADATGNINTTGNAGPIQIPVGQTMGASQTGSIDYANNLSASAPIGTTVQTNINVYDSLGTAYKVTQTFVKESANTWLAGVTIPGQTLNTGQLSRIHFNADGTFDSVQGLSGTFPTTSVTIPSLNLSNGAGATTSQTYTVFDSNNNPRVYKATYTNTGPNAWSYQLVDTASTTSTPVASGVIGYNGTTYTGFPISFTPSNSTTPVSINFTAATDPRGTFAGGTGSDTGGGTAKITGLQLAYTTPMQTTTFAAKDSAGTSHNLTVTYTAAGSNQWNYTISDGTTNATGTITYDPATGNYTPANLTTFKPNATDTLTVSLAGAVAPNYSTTNTVAANPSYTVGTLSPVTFTPTDGAKPMSIALNVNKLVQYGGDSTIQAVNQDGYAAGVLEKTTIDPTGTIVGNFSNGKTKVLAQIALATFNNPAGLTKVGENLFVKSTNSGEAQIGPSGSGGRGKFNPGSLEMSNVDLSAEFSNMIITQRGFQANSKIITTTDQMLEELVNLKR